MSRQLLLTYFPAAGINTEVRAFIIGASGGIGAGTARRLRAAGHDVTLAGRQTGKLLASADELGCSSATVDAADFDALDAAVRQLLRLGRSSIARAPCF